MRKGLVLGCTRPLGSSPRGDDLGEETFNLGAEEEAAADGGEVVGAVADADADAGAVSARQKVHVEEAATSVGDGSCSADACLVGACAPYDDDFVAYLKGEGLRNRGRLLRFAVGVHGLCLLEHGNSGRQCGSCVFSSCFVGTRFGVVKRESFADEGVDVFAAHFVDEGWVDVAVDSTERFDETGECFGREVVSTLLLIRVPTIDVESTLERANAHEAHARVAELDPRVPGRVVFVDAVSATIAMDGLIPERVVLWKSAVVADVRMDDGFFAHCLISMST